MKSMKKIYEDDELMAVLSPLPAVIGHILLFPKKHYTIIEQVPDYVVSKMFVIANKIASAVFQATGSTGTNILIQNGLAAGQKANHFMMHILARRENDGISFTWTPKQLSEEEMSTVELQLKEEASKVGDFEARQEEPVKEKETEVIQHDENDYRLKQLDRMP
jgi:histidine triad (HIT) family protein